ncbi:S-adenosyl-L-methionine-dependent methyltransferases superfamilyprotein [Zostera marina]|uniref:S-adenosyl-L-methionine-dependent methyltransferases superfamilyprotein n=1 Tax=Zostera marina TaxID=29655 RepID=A0A0K9PUU9_ZOSMR|nr:S-adenosyl-L-methionine-dependent methyltransferases superfamilyprotein [Zostera marina]
MEKSCCSSVFKLSRLVTVFMVPLFVIFVIVSIVTFHKFYSLRLLEDSCTDRFRVGGGGGYADFDVRALSERIQDALQRIVTLQEKLQSNVEKMDKSKQLRDQKISGSEFRQFLEEEVIQELYEAQIRLRLIRMPKAQLNDSFTVEDPLINFFAVEELRKYVSSKQTRRPGVSGMNQTYNSIGHACVLMKKQLEDYMQYDIGSYCADDWDLGQKLILGGCDPLPMRRCLARAPRIYQSPFPINESLWKLPDDRNVRWSKYQCRSFSCLQKKRVQFDMDTEKLKWVTVTNTTSTRLRGEFSITDVLSVKPEGEIRIGIDISVGSTGTFGARMKEKNVTIITTALNSDAPFSETISLRGLIPLYVSTNTRLPLFDNTMDLIHTSELLDGGWMDLKAMDFVLFDWDRVLRPGGLLWIDMFFCDKKEIDEFMYLFLQFSYRKHKWVLSPKSKDQIYLSALLEKTPRSL